MASPTLSVFFPTYNEQENIGPTLHSMEAVLADARTRGLISEYEIIVVNDGSRDNTASIVAEEIKNNERIRLIHHGNNRGYGAALQSGFAAALHDYVFFTDADRQFNFSELHAMLQHIPAHSVVIGYRAKRRDPWMRLVNAWGWKMLNRVFFSLKVRDIDCAFKLMKRDVVQPLPLMSHGAMASAELLVRLRNEGVIWKEVAVSHAPRTKGSPTGARPQVIVKAFREMVVAYRSGLGNNIHVTLFKFATMGVINTLVDWCVYYALTRGTLFFPHHIVLAKALSFVAGTVPSFFGNKFWTFHSTKSLQSTRRINIFEVVRFYMSVSVAALLNIVTVYILVHQAGWHDLWAVFVATCISFLGSFFLTKNWVFHNARSEV
jgi:glycosyltransferase involved in cell wall biosynthesis